MKILNRHFFKRSVIHLAVITALLSASVSWAQVPELIPVPMQGGGATALPNIGGEGGGLSWAEERQFGDYIAGLIQQSTQYEQDPLLHDYVDHVWRRLLKASTKNHELSPELQNRMAWNLFLIRDPTVNAFALPGAYVGVNLGLISTVESEDELASVLAHESVHIFQRHIARAYGLSKDLSAVSIGSTILGILAMAIDPNLGGAILTGGQAASIQGEIDFTRAMEHEADRIGYKILVDAGYNPQGMAAMFQRLAEASKFSDTTSFPYLRTHPLTDVRIAEAQTRLGIGTRSQPQKDDLLQDVMGGRAKVISNQQLDSLNALVTAVYNAKTHQVKEDASLKALYAGAFAALKLKQFEKVDAIYPVLLQKAGNSPVTLQAIILFGIEAALAQDHIAQAQTFLEQLNVAEMPMLERSALFAQAQVALAKRDAAQAIKLLEPWTRTHMQDDFAWELLSKSYQQNGKNVLALRSDAEAKMAIGDYNGAIDRFKAALGQGHSGNATVYDLELIQARLKVAQQAQEERQKAFPS